MSFIKMCLVGVVGLFCYQFATGLVRFRASQFDHEELLKERVPEAIKEEIHHQKALDDNDCSKCPGANAVCVPFVQCPAHVRAMNKKHSFLHCDMHHGIEGVCCSTGQNYTTHEDLKIRNARNFNDKSLRDAESKGRRKLRRLMERENEILTIEHNKTILLRHNPSFGQFQSQRTINFKDAFEISQDGLQNLFTMQALKDRQAITNEDVSLGLQNIQPTEASCLPKPDCSQIHSAYRKLDGSCNNVKHHTWGAARTPYERLIPPDYEDGTWSPRGFSTLPSAREISSKIIPDKDRPHSRATLLTMQFGQFITHDITSSVPHTHGDGKAIACCSSDGKSPLPQQLQHFACFPITIPPDDKFFKLYKQRCMNFVRTQLAPNHDCSIGFARQMNGVTHFLDLSQIYGSHPDTLSGLREWSSGRLRMFNDFGRDLCPVSDDINDCVNKGPGAVCFKSGDGHANMMVTLLAVHTVFSREHNRIAGILADLNPHWSDQLLFLESRKILIAEYQHIIFNEWLPLVLGITTMENFDLMPRKFGYSQNYNQKTNPGITNEFGAAAFRFGHSTVDGKLRIPLQTEVDEIISISEVMFHPSRIRMREFYDRLLNGLTSQPMQETDPSMSIQLTRYLFKGGNPHGLDLASLNIQRGRDHGLRSYNDYRKLVGQSKIERFDEFGQLIKERLASVYHSPEDVDLWVGGLLETPTDDSLVGLTFGEIIADQFSRLKNGDRYFYEYGPNVNPGHFSLEKLQEIRKTSMARLVCDNSDHIEVNQQSQHAFIRPDIPGNERIPCESLPSIDFTPWKEF